MNPFPEDDEDLTQFLQRHRSTPPLPAPGLEDRIIHSLPPRRSSLSRPLILVAAGMAACFLGVIIAQPVRSPSVNAEAIEFMESNWSGVLEEASNSDAGDYLAFVENN